MVGGIGDFAVPAGSAIRWQTIHLSFYAISRLSTTLAIFHAPYGSTVKLLYLDRQISR